MRLRACAPKSPAQALSVSVALRRASVFGGALLEQGTTSPVLHGAQVCPVFKQLFATRGACWAGGLALQWGVGFALPLALVYALERRTRCAFCARLQRAPAAGAATSVQIA